ncbi:alpha/beta hydrolase [Nioella aestuarii]|uniref:alpha/beta hydrolase n=1 Tax=Nioella aestuarii TaxID=1662864 RepID=UPI003D7F7C2A
MTVQGPAGQLAGTIAIPQSQSHTAALILPGSGPTDRNGNNPLGLFAASYRLLAEDLAAEGITTLRFDKRGIGASQGDPNDVTLSEYAEDATAWIAELRRQTERDCVWLLGHSEGAIIATMLAERDDVCGIALIAAPGRNVGDLFREQVASQPLIAPSAEAFDIALEEFAAGGTPDLSGLHPGLHALFAPQTARYMRDLIAANPGDLLAETTSPVIILHGDGDVQAPPSEAAPLVAARPDAEAHVLSGMTHVLKRAIPRSQAPSNEAFTQASLATYADPNAPLHEELVPLLTQFMIGGPAPETPAAQPSEPVQSESK